MRAVSWESHLGAWLRGLELDANGGGIALGQKSVCHRPLEGCVGKRQPEGGQGMGQGEEVQSECGSRCRQIVKTLL